MDNGITRRRFLKRLLAACALLLIRREKGAVQRTAAADLAEKSYMFVPMISRFVTLDCVPAGGIPFRLDISTLDSGHVLVCAG